MDNLNKPKILLMGLRRSGKSSIQKVVFQKMSPHETLFLESSVKVAKHDVNNNSFVQFSIWDFPGQLGPDEFDAVSVFGEAGSIVFIIDAQDDTQEAEGKLVETVNMAFEINPELVFEVFIHKVDGLSEENKIDLHRTLRQRVSDELTQLGKSSSALHITFHLTSIYDHSIFEAFSKVIQKLIPQYPTLESLLDMYISNSRVEKAFLFDVLSKIYIATDSSPVDNATYELCSDMIDVVIDISSIYGVKNEDGCLPPADDSGAGGMGQPAGTYFPCDNETSSIIKLSTNTVLYLRQVNRFLAMVCLLKEENFDKFGLINYNFQMFRQAIQDVFNAKAKQGAN
eukprot:TRINITY_DN61130_c0_g1_i1.p1 TRINITY_DN61130_c0_g1~~TRINITY_DN61130_c0_g1_i1.p1  ORF type:complete len:394 (+),score=38.06 TRINITY_DN61130_c0_g1_i1:162-1184(+)